MGNKTIHRKLKKNYEKYHKYKKNQIVNKEELGRCKRIRKLKDKQHNSQRTDNTIAKEQTTQQSKNRQHNSQRTDNTIAKEQTTQQPKKKEQMNKQSKKRCTKTKDRATRTPFQKGIFPDCNIVVLFPLIRIAALFNTNLSYSSQIWCTYL